MKRSVLALAFLVLLAGCGPALSAAPQASSLGAAIARIPNTVTRTTTYTTAPCPNRPTSCYSVDTRTVYIDPTLPGVHLDYMVAHETGHAYYYQRMTTQEQAAADAAMVDYGFAGDPQEGFADCAAAVWGEPAGPGTGRGYWACPAAAVAYAASMIRP